MQDFLDCRRACRSYPKVTSVDGDNFGIVSQFCYLGDGIVQTGGCVDAVIIWIRSASKVLHDYLPLLTNHGIYFAHGGIYLLLVSVVCFFMQMQHGHGLRMTCLA